MKNIVKYKKEKNPELFTPKEIEQMLKKARDSYYNSDVELMSDSLYDKLEDYLREIKPNSPLLKNVGAGAPVTKKIKLPFNMPSLSKAKDPKAFESFITKYTGPYVVSDKMDGISLLLDGRSGKWKVYTRGNGREGMDISLFAKHLKLPKCQNIAARVEIELDNTSFASLSPNAENPRSFVSGLINSKNPSELLKKCTLFAHELIYPVKKPSVQLKILETYGFTVPKYKVVRNIDYNILSKYLASRKSSSKFSMDGLVIIQDSVNPRTTKDRPEYAIAFKQENEAQETTVIDVIWAPSKHSYLKPRVHIKPLRIDGTTVKYCSGHNAKFIVDNGIGPKAVVQVIKAGEIIPYITKVVKKVKPQLPMEKYEWTDSGVDIVLSEENDVVIVKKMTEFLKNIGVEGVKIGLVTRLYTSGITTIPALLRTTTDTLLKIEGIQEKTALKIVEQIKVKVKSASLGQLMNASGCFDRTLGPKRLEALSKIKDLISLSKENVRKEVSKLDGFSDKTTESFLEGLVKFKIFIKQTKLDPKVSVKVKKTGKLTGKKYCFTKVRDKSLEEKIESLGGEVVNNVTKDLTALIVKDLTVVTTKTQKAKELGIKIIPIAKFSV